MSGTPPRCPDRSTLGSLEPVTEGHVAEGDVHLTFLRDELEVANEVVLPGEVGGDDRVADAGSVHVDVGAEDPDLVEQRVGVRGDRDVDRPAVDVVVEGVPLERAAEAAVARGLGARVQVEVVLSGVDRDVGRCFTTGGRAHGQESEPRPSEREHGTAGKKPSKHGWVPFVRLYAGPPADGPKR